MSQAKLSIPVRREFPVGEHFMDNRELRENRWEMAGTRV
jgi:hypothetical protein